MKKDARGRGGEGAGAGRGVPETSSLAWGRPGRRAPGGGGWGPTGLVRTPAEEKGRQAGDRGARGSWRRTTRGPGAGRVGDLRVTRAGGGGGSGAGLGTGHERQRVESSESKCERGRGRMFQPPTPGASAAGTAKEMDGEGETRRAWPGAAPRQVTAPSAEERGRGSSCR